MKADSFTVDMEPLSHLCNKDLTLSSRIIRSPSRKESKKGIDRKMNSNYVMSEGNGDNIHSPKGSSPSLKEGTTPQRLMLMDQTTDHINSPQLHHQIAIMAGGTIPTTTVATATAAATTKPPGTPTKSSGLWKKSRSFKQSSIINPRRILMFFATFCCNLQRSDLGSMPRLDSASHSSGVSVRKAKVRSLRSSMGTVLLICLTLSMSRYNEDDNSHAKI